MRLLPFKKISRVALTVFLPAFPLMGCAALFGWDIHSPGVLSQDFVNEVEPLSERVALYLDPQLIHFTSRDRGSALSDPQTYHVGEALQPMLLEAFQEAFDEFVFFEIEPGPALLKQYGISYLVTIRAKGFDNRKGRPLNRQVIELVTEVSVYDTDLSRVRRFESKGTSDARKVFAKRGGPEVNLNAAIESNILATIRFLQDALRR